MANLSPKASSKVERFPQISAVFITCILEQVQAKFTGRLNTRLHENNNIINEADSAGAADTQWDGM